MIVRCLGVGLAAVLALGALTACSAPKPHCTFNKVQFSPMAFVGKGGRLREMRADITIGGLGGNQLQGMELSGSDLTVGKKFAGPPPGVNAAVVLAEGHRYRLSVAALLASGQQVRCGTMSVTVPTSTASTPVITPTQPASSA